MAKRTGKRTRRAFFGAAIFLLAGAGPAAFAQESGALRLAPSPQAAPVSGPRPCARKDALGTFRDVVVGAPAGGLHIGLESYPETLDLKPGEVVLTFDDGPNPATTRRVLDALKAECVQATFFLIGRHAQAYPGLVRREIAEGHTIGSHSWSHPWRTLIGIPYDAAIREISRGMAAVDKAAYGAADRDGQFRTTWFRFPGFADDGALLAWLDRKRVTVFGADLWASDWNAMTPEQESNLLMKRLAERGRRGIILLHDTRRETVEMLPIFLHKLKRDGYHVVHMVPGPAAETKLRPAPKGWKSETKAILAKIMPRLLKKRKFKPAAGKSPAAPPPKAGAE